MGDISVGQRQVAYLANDIGQRQAALDKASTYQPWRMCNGWVTSASANDRRHQLRPAHIGRGMCTFGK